MKTDKKLTNELIFKAFSKPIDPKCEIIACYLYTKEMCVQTIKSFQGVGGMTPDDLPEDYKKEETKTNVICEFLDKKGLEDLLFHRKKVNDGILQKFISPKESNNSTIRLVWTPHFCLCEKRVNNLPLHDKRFDFYERACTYEGKEFYSRCCIYCKL